MSARWWLLLALLAGVLLGPKIAELPGFVLIGSGTSTVELRLSLAVALACVLLMLTLLLGASAGFLASIDKQVRRFSRGQRQRQARDLTGRGLRALAEGRWQEAETDLLKAAKASDAKLINYLAAAMAAQEEHALERRDRYLQQAQIAEPEADLAVGMMEARLHLRNGHYQHALLILLELDRLYPRHAPCLKLLQHVYRRLRDIDGLERLLPRLEKFEVLNRERLHQLHAEIVRTRLAQARGQADELRQLWRSAPKALRRDSALFSTYVRALQAAGHGSEGERLTRKFLDRVHNRELVALYGELIGRDAGAQLHNAEQWLERYEADAVLLLCLARLAMRAQNWLKARRYLEQMVSPQPGVVTKINASAEVWLMLAEVYEQLQEPGQMQACLKAALRTAKAA